MPAAQTVVIEKVLKRIVERRLAGRGEGRSILSTSGRRGVAGDRWEPSIGWPWRIERAARRL